MKRGRCSATDFRNAYINYHELILVSKKRLYHNGRNIRKKFCKRMI